jgi:hypothetical protein
MKTKLHDGHLGRSQLAVIDDLLHGLSERETLRKNHISPYRYRKWRKNALFNREFADRKESLHTQRRYILISSLPQAARRLAELINCEKDEVARKACLDIINFQRADAEQEKAEEAERAKCESHQPKISPEKASRMLAILAEPDEPSSIKNPKSEIQNQADGWQPPQVDGTANVLTDAVGGMARSEAWPCEGSSNQQQEILAGAKVCGIKPSLLAVAFPHGLPQDFMEKLCQVAKSPGSNPDREIGLKSRAEAEAAIQRRKRLIRTY